MLLQRPALTATAVTEITLLSVLKLNKRIFNSLGIKTGIN
jgi:hypothetical protein